MKFIDALNYIASKLKEEDDPAKKLVYIRYGIDLLFDIWRYTKDPIVYILFHCLVPSYNILSGIARKGITPQENILPYINRMSSILLKAISIVFGEKSAKNINKVMELIEHEAIPLENDLLDFRGASEFVF